MKPVEFKHQNAVYGKDQPEYQPLPALKIQGDDGHIVSCWKMSIRERMKVLFTGRVWVDLMCFNKPITPSFLSVDRKKIYSHPDDKSTIRKLLIVAGLWAIATALKEWWIKRKSRK